MIARLAGGVLTLSAGDDPERYGDAGGQWYGSIINETFRIDAVRDVGGAVVPGSVRVRSQGVERSFTGVSEILAAGGAGNDLFEIGADIDAVLRLSGGSGSDTFLVHSFAAGSSFTGGPGYDTLVLPGVATDYLFKTTADGPSLAPASAPAMSATLATISVIRLADGPVAMTGKPVSGVSSAYTAANDDRSRAHAGPIVNSDVHLALRTYADGVLVRNLDLLPDEHEPSTTTDTQGTYEFPADTLTAADRNGDGVTDWRDGMVVVGSRSDNGVGTVISVIDSISGSDMGFPLVGLPGHNATLLTTLKYAGLLRWQPGMNVAGVEVTPALINALRQYHQGRAVDLFRR